MVRILGVCVALLVGLGGVFGQDTPTVPAEPVDGVEAFLAGLSGFDEGLCGETKLKLLYGSVELGEGTLVVAAAPEGSGGTYLLKLDMSLEMGPSFMRMKAEAVLDEKLALVSGDHSAQGSMGGEKSKKTTKIRRAEGHFTWEHTEDGEVCTRRIAADRPNHGDDLAVILIARKLASAKAGEYVLNGIDWPSESDPSPDHEPSWKKLTFQVGEPVTALFGDVEIETREVRRVKPDSDRVAVVTVGAAGRFISLKLPGEPVTIIDEQLVALPDDTITEATGAETPRAAVAVFFEILAGIAKADALDAVVDWEAVHASAAATKQEVAIFGVSAYARLFKAELMKGVGRISEDQLRTFLPMLKVEVNGERAVVTMPNKEDAPFELEKIETGWVITRMAGT